MKTLREYNNGKLPTIKESIEYICTTYGGCEFVGEEKYHGTRLFIFNAPARTWHPRTEFTVYELRWTFIHGW